MTTTINQPITKQQALQQIQQLMQQQNIDIIDIPDIDVYYDYAGCYTFSLNSDNKLSITYNTTTPNTTSDINIPAYILKQALGLLTINIID